MVDSKMSEAILDGAARLFLQYGYRRTTVDDIAAEAGIAKGSVYLHFKSKEAVFAAVCRRLARIVLDKMEELAAGEGAASERLKRIMIHNGLYLWDFCHQAPHAPDLWTEVTAEAAKYTLEAYADGRNVIAGVITEGQAAGELRRDMTADELAWVVQLSFAGFNPPFTLIEDRRQVERQLPHLAEVVIAGMTC